MNYGSISQFYSLIPLYSSKERLNRIGHDRNFIMIDESTPLIIRRRRNSYNAIVNWKVFSLILIFTIGLSIGIYLLAVEYQEQSANFRYKLIELNAWYGETVDSAQFSNTITLQLPVSNIIVSHTHGDHCYMPKKCAALINSMIKDDLLDIPYNFLISGSGDSYEVRGWKYVNGFPAVYNKNESIAVAFIGDFTIKTPTDKQIAELHAFINEAIRRKQLTKNFNLYGVESDDQENLKLHERLRNIKQFSGIL